LVEGLNIDLIFAFAMKINMYTIYNVYSILLNFVEAKPSQTTKTTKSREWEIFQTLMITDMLYAMLGEYFIPFLG